MERFNCKIMAAANSYFRFAVAILFVYIVRAIFKRHCNDLRDRSGDQIRRGRCRKSLGVSPALDEV